MTLEMHASQAVVRTNRAGHGTWVATNVDSAKAAAAIHEQRRELAWESPDVVNMIMAVAIPDTGIRLRTPINFQDGELLYSIEVYTSPDDCALRVSPRQQLHGVLCSALRLVTSTGRGVMVCDGAGMLEQPTGSLYSKFSCDGRDSSCDSYMMNVDIQHGCIDTVTPVHVPGHLCTMVTSCPHSTRGYGLELDIPYMESSWRLRMAHNMLKCSMIMTIS